MYIVYVVAIRHVVSRSRYKKVYDMSSRTVVVITIFRPANFMKNNLITNLLVNGFLEPALVYHVARRHPGLNLTLRQHLILKIIRVGPYIKVTGFDAVILVST